MTAVKATTCEEPSGNYRLDILGGGFTFCSSATVTDFCNNLVGVRVVARSEDLDLSH